MLIKQFVFALFALFLMLLGLDANAAGGPDFSTLTSAVDFSTATAAILSVAALLAVVYVTWRGAKMVLGAIKR